MKNLRFLIAASMLFMLFAGFTDDVKRVTNQPPATESVTIEMKQEIGSKAEFDAFLPGIETYCIELAGFADWYTHTADPFYPPVFPAVFVFGIDPGGYFYDWQY